jgi:hypothetical protein
MGLGVGEGIGVGVSTAVTSDVGEGTAIAEAMGLGVGTIISGGKGVIAGVRTGGAEGFTVALATAVAVGVGVGAAVHDKTKGLGDCRGCHRKSITATTAPMKPPPASSMRGSFQIVPPPPASGIRLVNVRARILSASPGGAGVGTKVLRSSEVEASLSCILRQSRHSARCSTTCRCSRPGSSPS